MVNREVRNRLLNTLAISKQALSQRANALKQKYGPMTTDEAVYVLAHLEGIDLSRYLPLAIQDRIRSLVPREVQSTVIHKEPRSPTRGSRKRQMKATAYPLVDLETIDVANQLGANVFPQVFILENSIRNLIKETLSGLDPKWWDKYVPPQVQKNVARTIRKESRYRYRRSRGDDPLLYSNFADLKLIILANPEGKFSDVLIKPDWFTAGMDDVYMARNNLAHSIRLEPTDIDHIHIFSREWVVLLETVLKSQLK